MDVSVDQLQTVWEGTVHVFEGDFADHKPSAIRGDAISFDCVATRFRE